MRICRRSAVSFGTSVLALCATTTLVAQTATGAPAPVPPPVSARAKASAEGDRSMDRLQRAIAEQKTSGTASAPPMPVSPGSELRQRAFSAMRNRRSSPAMEARARAAVAIGREALSAQRDAMARQIGQALGIDAPDMAAVASVTAPKPANAWVPVLFVSSSMPISTLRNYAGQLERVGGVLAFRGMPGGLIHVAPMAKLSAEILRIDPGCDGPSCAMRNVQLIVDPIVFRQHGITRVPALAVIPGDPTQPYCERDADSPHARQIVFGDAALSGLLEEYARLGGKEEVRDAQARLRFR